MTIFLCSVCGTIHDNLKVCPVVIPAEVRVVAQERRVAIAIIRQIDASKFHYGHTQEEILKFAETTARSVLAAADGEGSDGGGR